MLIMHWEDVCYEILVYKSKLSKIKTFPFPKVQLSQKGYLC